MLFVWLFGRHRANASFTSTVYLLELMPLTRQKHKNSSRSPGVGISSASYFQSSSTPKGFHPPSYYAVAAGLTHPHPDDDKSAEVEVRRTTTADRSLADPDDSFVPAPMPTAQLPTSSSASSTEPNLVSRMSFLNKRLSKANGIYTPSYQDSHDPFPSSSQHQPYPSTSPARQRPQIVPIKTSFTPPTGSVQRFPNVLESSRIPTPVGMAKAKPNLKPALKNTVTSTSWCSGGQGSPTRASPSRSLRSVKGIIGRKMPQIPAEPVPSHINGAQTGNVSTPSIVCVTIAQVAYR